MVDNKRFYKTVIVVTVLTEDEPVTSADSLSYIDREITEGGWSGKVEVREQTELTKAEVAEALRAQGSDPDFFGDDLSFE